VVINPGSTPRRNDPQGLGVPTAPGAQPRESEAEPQPRKVRRLPGPLIDQIAAGEVVERPASIVKELVENSLDAASRRIRIALRGGGVESITVTDDGWGMTPEDARLALERHATSKISRAEDLNAIGSYGFRGEALPSIAAVARVRLRTRTRGSETGYELVAEAGQVGEGRSIGHPPGTRIEVADLFAQIPARRKFLKRPATEWRHIADGLARIALARPEVHFDVERDDRSAISWPAVDDALDRVAAVLSDRDAEALVRIEARRGSLHVRGFASRPDAHRPTAAGLYLFVNGRPVRDRLLRHALLEVYRDVLPRGRFPTALLFLEVPRADVDVNVHPAKWEVRFADPQNVHAVLRAAVRVALAERRWLAGAARRSVGFPAKLTQPTAQDLGGAPRPAETTWVRDNASADWTDWRFAGGGDAPAEFPAGGAPFHFAELSLIGQWRATYLILESADALLLVDQHAAHERVLFEGFRAQWRAGGVAQQALLLPVTVELATGAAADAEALAAWAAPLGFELEVFGDRTLAVRAVPALLADRNPEILVLELGEEWAVGGQQGPARTPEAADAVFASMACHSARRAGDRMDPREQRELLDALDAIPWAPTCPHGRPVAIPLSVREIERRFGRSD